MTLIQDAPVMETDLKVPEVTLPAPVAVTAPPKPSVWPKVVRYTAVGLAGLGIGASLGLGIANTIAIDSLQSDVATVQADLASTQDQLIGVRNDLALQGYGISLVLEHVAQAP